MKGSPVIQAYRPITELEDLLGKSGARVRVTGAELVDGKVHTYLDYDGQPRKIEEDPGQVFGAIRVTGATLINVGFGNGNIYYILGEIDQAYIPANFLSAAWLQRDRFLRTITGARLAGDGVDYDISDAGRPGTEHESEASVFQNIRIKGVRGLHLTGVT
jgi:hypothetical protein